MDDVVLFGIGTLGEWAAYNGILYLFCSASSMSVSIEESSFLCNNLQEDVNNSIQAILPYKK